MKRKSIILLASTVLGLGLVGGTLAAWAVTDNADPVGITVSPGNVDTDTQTKYTTLNWGEKKSLSNVGNLLLGSKRLAGVLDVRQTASESFPGRLSYLIAGDQDLIDSLEVDVYTGVFEGARPGDELSSSVVDAAVSRKQTLSALSPAKASETKGMNFNAVANNGENLFSVVVYLKDSVDTDDYAALASQSVDISFDWGLSSAETPVTTTTLYLDAGGLGSNPKIYAWKGDGTARNAAYPGVAMIPMGDGIFSLDIDLSKYDKVIFNNGTADGAKSGDIVISEKFTDGKNQFNYSGVTELDPIGGTFSQHTDEVVEKQYYLVGENLTYGGNAVTWGAVANCKLTLTAGSVSFDVHTEGNARLKIFESTKGSWISNDGNDFTLGDAGDYTITFIENPTGEQSHIGAVKK